MHSCRSSSSSSSSSIKRPGSSLVVLLLACGQLWHAQPAAAQANRTSVVSGLPKVIPLPLLLGNTKYRNPQLSNDGKLLAYIKPDPSNSVNNLYVRRLPSDEQMAGMKHDVALMEQPGAGGTDLQVTFDTKRGVHTYAWAEDGSALFYTQDKDGDEQDHLFLIQASSLASSSGSSRPVAVDLTPFPGVKVQGIITNERWPRKVYLTMNKRDARVFDLYLLDLDTGELTLHMVNNGEASAWLVDYDFNVRGIDGYNSSDGSNYVLINDALSTKQTATTAKVQEEKGSSSKTSASKARGLPIKEQFAQAAAGNWTTAQWMEASLTGTNISQWRLLVRWPFDEEGAVFRFNKAGDGLFGVSSDNRDTTEFQLISTAPGAKVMKRIASNPHANAGTAVFNPQTWEPQLVSHNYLKTVWTVLDPAIKADWDKLQAFKPNAVPSIVSRSFDLKHWLVVFTSDNQTTGYYLYKPGKWPPQLLFEVQPELNAHTMASMHAVVYKARDGLRVPAYLTLPVRPTVPGVLPACVTGDVPDATPAARAAAADSPLKCPLGLNLPLVLYVHGGPWSRDSWGADSVVQFLANRGYAVLQPNYRGSTGYSKSFVNAGNGQWGTGSMQHDLTDAVRWAIEKGIADPQRVCIMGGSYGGYAVLAGLAFTPQLYACGVDLVGISNVASFMKSIPPYWEPILIDFIKRVGDVSKNDTLNRQISPLFSVDKIRAPLFIAQGANDPRVPQAESDQMFKAMKAKGLDVRYMLYSDEGHGLVRADNRLDFYSRVEQFLGQHLGGRSEPLVQQPGSTAKVIA